MTEISLRRYEDYFNDYRRNDECGRGKFGTVYNVTHLKSGKSFASKHVRIRKSDQRQKVLSEIEILQKISNPHIVKFKEAFESFNEIIIITEYLYGGELFDRFRFMHKVLIEIVLLSVWVMRYSDMESFF